MIIPPTESEISRFSGKYNIDPVTGCWLWTAAVDKTGYGAFSGDRGLRKRNDNWRAHRWRDNQASDRSGISDGKIDQSAERTIDLRFVSSERLKAELNSRITKDSADG